MRLFDLTGDSSVDGVIKTGLGIGLGLGIGDMLGIFDDD